MDFKKVDELGITRDYFGITKLQYEDNTYLIYTDFVPNEEDDPRLFVGLINEDTIEDVTSLNEKVILSVFRKIESDYINKVMEMVL